MDVPYVFTPFLALPVVMAFHPDGEGTPRAPPMFDHGQFGQDQQAVVGHFFLPDQIRHGDQDPPAPGTHRITSHDLLRVDEEDAAFADSDQGPPCLRFLEDLVS